MPHVENKSLIYHGQKLIEKDQDLDKRLIGRFLETFEKLRKIVPERIQE
jgi:hypothetical protein